MKVVIDTNVLRLTIKKTNFERFIYDAFKDEAFDWVVSTEILEEYEEKLIDFYSTQTANLVLGILEMPLMSFLQNRILGGISL